MTFGVGASAIVCVGTIFIPPLARIGLLLSATVYRRNAPMPPPIMTFSNTSHGPQKSMMTAPSEIRNATGMPPLAGGVSLLVTTLDDFAGTDSCAANARENGTAAAAKPSAAEFFNSSLRFI